MEQREVEELIKVFESANQGNWMPIATVTFAFGLVISLLLVIWKQSQKNNDKRHEASEKRHEENEAVIKSNNETIVKMGMVLAKYGERIESNTKMIEKLE